MSVVTWQLTNYSWSFLVTSTPYVGVPFSPVNPGAPVIEQWPGNPELGDYSVTALGPHTWLVNEVQCPLVQGACGQPDLTTLSFAKAGYWSEPLGKDQFLVGWTPPPPPLHFAADPVVSTPEPSTLIMLTLGLAMLLYKGKKLATVRAR